MEFSHTGISAGPRTYAVGMLLAHDAYDLRSIQEAAEYAGARLVVRQHGSWAEEEDAALAYGRSVDNHFRPDAGYDSALPAAEVRAAAADRARATLLMGGAVVSVLVSAPDGETPSFERFNNAYDVLLDLRALSDEIEPMTAAG